MSRREQVRRTMNRSEDAYPECVRQILDWARTGASSETDFAERKAEFLRVYDTLIHTIGLVGEAGEIADEVKKVFGHGKPLNLEKLTDERGDLSWYYEAVGEDLGIAEGASEARNEAKLQKRFPEGFTVAAAKARADECHGGIGPHDDSCEATVRVPADPDDETTFGYLCANCAYPFGRHNAFDCLDADYRELGTCFADSGKDSE